ncbi:MAG: DUF4105 domain-containing protein [Cyclobacteriaceae bacterium]
MFKKLIISFFLALLSGFGWSQTLSEKAEISVYTMGPLQTELYSAFGHSAFRVLDPDSGWDLIYNYGVFDFDQPNFYLNFAKGTPYYKLGVHDYKRFYNVYLRDDRRIVQQVLNLNKEEKQRLFDFLQWNALPENQNYYYNYIYDNCATKIRDVMDSVFNNTIEYDYSYVNQSLSFRDLMDMYLGEQPWGDLGIDICLGTGIDKEASGYHYMYLPDYVEKAFNGATTPTDSTRKPLIKTTNVLNEGNPISPPESFLTPNVVFIGIFLFFGFISFKDFKRGQRSNWVDILLFSIAGIVGWLLAFLWFFTDHISSNNFNMIWAMPAHMVVVPFLLQKNHPYWLRKYFLGQIVILGLLIALWGFWPQNLHDSLIPFALILLIRSILIVRFGSIRSKISG